MTTTMRPPGTPGYPVTMRDSVTVSQAVPASRIGEESFRRLFEMTGLGLVVLDQAGVVVDANSIYAEMTGYASVAQILGHTILEWTADRHKERSEEAIRQCLAQGLVRGFKIDYLTPNGQTRSVEIDAAVIGTGAQVEILALCRDITEQVAAEEGLRQAESRYKNIFENALEGIFQSTPDGRFISANPAMARALGYDSSGELARCVTDIGTQIYANPETRRQYVERLQREGAVEDFEVEFRRKDGSVMWTSLSAFAVRDNQGRVIRYEGFIRDISRQKAAESALALRNAVLTTQMESSLDGILVVDANEQILSLNQRFIEMWDIPQTAVDSHSDQQCLQTVLDRVVDPEGFVARVRHLYEHREKKSSDEIVLRDGRAFERYSAPMFAPDGSYYGRVWFTRDVTDRKRAEEALRAEQRLFVGGPTVVFRWKAEATAPVEYVSPNVRSQFGHDVETLVGGRTSFASLIHPDDTDRVVAEARSFTAERIPSFELEYRLRHGDGSYRWVHTFTTVERDGNGTVTHYSGYVLDITERKRSEDELRATRQQLADIIEFLPDATFVIDRDKKVIAWNRAIEEMTGTSKESMLGQGDYAYAVPWYGTRRPILIDLIGSSHSDFAKEYEFVLQKGSTLFAEVFVPSVFGGKGAHLWVTASPLLDAEGNQVGAIESVRDISERVRAERQLVVLSQLRAQLLDAGTLASKVVLITEAVVASLDADFARIWITKASDRCEKGCRHAARTEGGDACRDRSRCLHLVASSGRYAHTAGRHSRVPLGCYKIGRVATGEEPFFVSNDVTNDPRVHDHEWARSLGLVSFGGYRLRSPEGRTIGVLALFRKSPITEPDMRLLEDLANIASQVIATGMAEEALRESEATLAGTFVAAPVGIWLERQRVIFMSNDRASEITGFTSSEMNGRSTRMLYPDSREYERAGHELYTELERVGRTSAEVQWLRKDGTAIDVMLSAAPLDASDPSVGNVITALDITERNRAERTRVALHRISEAAHVAKDLAGLLHQTHVSVAEIMPAENLFVALQDTDTGKISFPYFADSVDPQPPPRAPHKGLTEYVLRTGQALHATSEQVADLERQGEIERIGTPATEWIGVPIMMRGRAAGVLAMQSYSQRTLYQERDKIILQLVANQVASAIERNHAERTLRESEERYRQLVELSPDCVAVHCNGRVVFVNSACARLFGAPSREELVGMQVLDLVHPSSREVVRQRIGTMLGEGAQAPLLEETFLRLDGTPVAVEASAGPLSFEGRPAVLVAFRDISDRRAAQEQAIRARHYLKNIIDSMPSVLAGVDSEGRITEWNAQAESQTGIPAALAMGKPLAAAIPWLVDHLDHMLLAPEAGAPRKIARVIRDVAGEKRFCDVVIYPLVAGGGGGAVVRIDDVTDHVKMEQMLVQTEKIMAVGGIAAGVAHEINNPLSGILQGVQNISRRTSDELPRNVQVALECGTTIDTIQAYLQKREISPLLDGIRVSAERAARIVTDMLQFSRPSQLQVTHVDLVACIEGMVALAGADFDLKKRYDFRSIQIVREYDPNLGPVPCVATQLEIVILNLLKNAAHALHQQRQAGSGEPPRICLRTHRDGDMAQIEVEDNGPGLDELTRKRVFEPFFTTKEPGIGTGLGLSVSYFVIVELHRGELSVESAPGRGACFTIRIPLVGKTS